MSATQIYHPIFDRRFLRLPTDVQQQIEAKLYEMGTRLQDFPHYQLTGCDEFRLRVGDYRVIYDYNVSRNEIYLLAVGHRREVYR